MARYAAFGFVVDCDFELPELPRIQESSARCWRIETRDGTAPICPDPPIGSDAVYAGVRVDAYVMPGTFRLAFDDTGTFDVLPAERRIVWYPRLGAPIAAVRADLLGRVMALAAHADEALALHASAVSIDGEVVAFLGPKHAGKSTLALALVRRGARLVTDDTLVVRFDGTGAAWAAPGVQRVRLWDDSARALEIASHGDAGAKPTIEALPTNQLVSNDLRVTACYVLEAADPHRDVDDAVRRTRMSSVHAAVTCIRFSKLGSLAGGSESGIVLERASRLAAAVPVYSAAVHRDLTTVGEVAAVFMAWQRGAGASNVLAAG